ncbi:ABC transporter permease [Oleomonas cavernae]|uniref:ABC transporter permease n=1 Tax=Oleomonas cavernae TaxID=2320859 RepID=A0A418WU13_9PROT|nr:ABC transporter permease [Oleomonas cavernae]RJF94754.1 ABC transporter permease [Oleomonas cavernae]
MFRLVAGRIGLGLLTLFAVSALLYLGTQMLPGDVASALLGQQATPETLAALREKLGLNEPAWLRFLHWLWGAVQGDLGNSLANGRPIAAELLPRLGNTLFLASYAALLAVPLAVGLGILAAIRADGIVDRVATTSTLIAISVPEFFVAYVLVIIFASELGWLPSLATVYHTMGFLERLYVTTLPAITLTLVVAAHMMRMTRASILAVMSSPYIEMATLKGLRRRRVVVRHALPNAAAPIIAVVALNLAYLVVGVVVIEVVFVYPGIGQLMVDAVSKRDLPTVQACGLMFATTFVTLNTLADVLSILVNPRLRHKR